MKNREKFREMIVKCTKTPEMKADLCEFIKLNVLPHYFGKEGCEGASCDWCPILFMLWLDEEYEDPKVDWNNVPVDTLVRVRDREEQEWTLMYFKGISDYDRAHRFMTWCDGATSKTASGGDYVRWKYCELVEVEDE